MPDFWEEIRRKVLEHTTGANIAEMVYAKVASTGVAGPVIIKPAFYLSQLSGLTMNFMRHVETLLEAPDKDTAAWVRSICFLRETGRSIVTTISQVADPLERLITMTEEVLEGEEFSALEDDGENSIASDTRGGDEGAEREEIFPEKDKLEENLRSKFRKSALSEQVTNELAERLAEIYLECVQFARELSRLSKAEDEDTAAIMAILIDLQYGLDSQLRGLLVEDMNVNEPEPTFTLGFFTWSSHCLSELVESMSGESAEMVGSAKG
jgi:hypothetical protein